MFTVVIPVYNHQDYVGQAIDSCLWDPLVSEVLIVDDGSTDFSVETVELYRSNPKVKIVDNGRENWGAHHRLNQLCALSENEWICILNSDDIFTSGRFDIFNIQIRLHEPDAIFGSIEIIDQFGKTIGSKKPHKDLEYALPADLVESPGEPRFDVRIFNQNFIATTSNICIKKSVFLEIGGFEDFRYIHDWVLFTLLLDKYKTICVPNSLTKYRIHTSNTIRENASSNATDGEVSNFFCHYAKANQLSALRLAALEGNQHVDDGIKLGMKAARNSQHRQKLELPARPDKFEDFIDQQLALASTLVSNMSLPVPAAPFSIGFTADSSKTLLPGMLSLVENEAAWQSNHSEGTDESELPLVLILSGVFAVGGVERNTVEVVRHLKDKYRFLLVTDEHHSESIGSLHHQLFELGVHSLDLGHIVGRDKIKDALTHIILSVEPNLIWQINGSVLLSELSGYIRGLTGGIPIIDQQVYDTVAGWIAHFVKPGILASDRFIAVNRQIERTFFQKYKIQPDKISMIYPCFALEAVGRIDEKRANKDAILQSFGLSKGKKIVGFLGRLSPQKRPERFVELARQFEDDDDYEFVFFGRGPLQESLLQSPPSNLKFVDYYEDVSDVGAVLHCIAISSDFEGLPIAFLETISMGIPYFSTQVGDIPYVHDQFAGGILLDSWNSETVADLFREFLSEIEIHQSKLTEAHDDIIAMFSAENVAQMYADLFEDSMQHLNARMERYGAAGTNGA